MTQWQRAESQKQVEDIVAGWYEDGVFTETLTDDDMAYLKAGGRLCVFQGEHGLILNLAKLPEPPTIDDEEYDPEPWIYGDNE